MFGPKNPIRYYISYNLRKIIRSISYYILKNSWADKISDNELEYEVFKHELPIFREFSEVDRNLFENKRTNLEIAASKINKVLIEPGQKFSFWKLVGNPSESKGYLPGLTISQGNAAVDIGGGLCQFSNMIFFLTLHSDLEVVERHHHSFDIFPDNDRKVPFGTGATIVYNYKDICFYNPTSKTYQLCFDLKDDIFYGKLRVDKTESYKYSVFEDSCGFLMESGQYYRTNRIMRKKTDLNDNEICLDELFKNKRLCMYKPEEIDK